MTQVKKPGRPPKATARELMEEEANSTVNDIILGPGVKIVEDTITEQTPIKSNKMNFITVNTKQVMGLRINLDKIRTYATNEDTAIHVAWENGMSTSLIYNNKEQRDETLALMDKYCL